MSNISQLQLNQLVTEILQNVENKPFLCLPMSALLYANLIDRYKVKSKLVTGNLLFEGQFIFKQDFSVNSVVTETYTEWSGHAWIDINGMIIDLSIFRTLYSELFTKEHIKGKLVRNFGTGRGCLIIPPASINDTGLTYEPVDVLTDDQATAIIAGYIRLIT